MPKLEISPKNQFIALYKPNQIITGVGTVVVVTGWTPKKAVEKHLSPDEYAAIGQLYSPTRGISFLIRNLLYNPHANKVIILDATKEDKNSGACKCLYDFFSFGMAKGKSDIGRDCWVIDSSITGYIDIEIPKDALELLRERVEVIKVDLISKAIECVKDLNKRQDSSSSYRGYPLEFPYTEPKTKILPGTRYGHRIEGKTIAETWVKILQRIKITGTIRPTGYDGNWQELIDLMAIVTDEPPDFYFPEPNYLPINRSFLQEYIPLILDDSPYIEGVKYTYGQRLRSWFGFDQVEQVINKLISEIDAASAVMSLWDVKDHEKGGSPCLNHIWVRVVDNELSLTATFRSNDMFSAWPANAMGLRALQKHIRDEIAERSQYNLTMGPLITISQSAHIYDDTWENVDKLIANQYERIVSDRNFSDPVGNFLIDVENGQIIVQQTTPGSGEIVNCYTDTNPNKLIRKICSQCPAISPEHIGYLGIELQKAKVLDKNYIQDK